MPKRTNDFQQLVHMVEQAYAPFGAQVTESAMANMREIDVLIEAPATTASHRIKIAAETKDEKRALDVIVIEQYIGKYTGKGSIQVDQVVLVARKGFTKLARERAEQVGIKLFVLNEVTQSDWTKLVPPQLAFKMPLHIDSVKLVPPVPSKSGSDPLRDGRFVCTAHGTDYGSPLQWAQWLLKTQMEPNAEVMERLEAEAKAGDGGVTIDLPFPMMNYRLSFHGKLYTVNELRVEFHYVNATNSTQWASFKRSEQGCGDKIFDRMESELGGSRVRIGFPEGPTSQQLVVRFDAVSKPGQPKPLGSFDIKTIPTTVQAKEMPPAVPLKHVTQKIKAENPLGPAGGPKRLGRNDPCPCLSGKKYKHCCLRK